MYNYEWDYPGREPENAVLPAPVADESAPVAVTMESQASQETQKDPGPAPTCL